MAKVKASSAARQTRIEGTMVCLYFKRKVNGK